MKWCSKCGKELTDTATFCPGCGTPSPAQPYQQQQQPYGQQPYGQQPYYGQPYPPQYPQYGEPDIPNTGMNVLCFLIPILGLIFYLTTKDKTPRKANAMGKWALIGFCVNMVLSVLLSVLPILSLL